MTEKEFIFKTERYTAILLNVGILPHSTLPKAIAWSSFGWREGRDGVMLVGSISLTAPRRFQRELSDKSLIGMLAHY